MNNKQLVAQHAAQLVQDGMLVGLGTGSTANCFIEALALRRTTEGLNIQAVASSVISAIKAKQAGLPLVAIEHIGRLDVYVDGADEVAADLCLLKGRGSDLVREKLLAKAADEFWVLIEAGKRVEYIGQNFPIPVEAMPFAWQLVQAGIAEIGGVGRLRPNAAGDGLAITAYGSLVLDVSFEQVPDTRFLNNQLNAIPGIVEHGIFPGLATAVFCGENEQVTEQRL